MTAPRSDRGSRTPSRPSDEDGVRLQKVLAGAWGLALVVCAIFLIVAFSRISTASAQQNDGALATAKSQAAWSGIGLALCLAVAVIFGAIAYFVL